MVRDPSKCCRKFAWRSSLRKLVCHRFKRHSIKIRLKNRCFTRHDGRWQGNHWTRRQNALSLPVFLSFQTAKGSSAAFRLLLEFKRSIPPTSDGRCAGRHGRFSWMDDELVMSISRTFYRFYPRAEHRSLFTFVGVRILRYLQEFGISSWSNDD